MFYSFYFLVVRTSNSVQLTVDCHFHSQTELEQVCQRAVVFSLLANGEERRRGLGIEDLLTIFSLQRSLDSVRRNDLLVSTAVGSLLLRMTKLFIALMFIISKKIVKTNDYSV